MTVIQRRQHCPGCRCHEELSDPSEYTVGGMHARPTATEKAAAYAVLPRSGSQRLRVLDAIGIAGERGHTDDELQRAVCPGAAARRNELRDGGWVEDTGRTRPTSKGGYGSVWVLTPSGRAAWEGGDDL